MTLTEYLAQYGGTITADGASVASFTPSILNAHTIRLAPVCVVKQSTHAEPVGNRMVRIVVKPYMTKEATPEFDFMEKFNNNVPMPLVSMVGTIEKETRGMYYMNLHGDTDGKPVERCMRCGRVITHPVSRFFGLGIECGGHNYRNPFATEEELNKAVDDYRKNVLQKMTWSGWVIKSAIKEMVDL